MHSVGNQQSATFTEDECGRAGTEDEVIIGPDPLLQAPEIHLVQSTSKKNNSAIYGSSNRSQPKPVTLRPQKLPVPAAAAAHWQSSISKHLTSLRHSSLARRGGEADGYRATERGTGDKISYF